jgi:hypothetical protein
MPSNDLVTTPVDVHDLVIDDVKRSDYVQLTALIAVHREATRHYGPDPAPALTWHDPITEAAAHLAAALVHLRRATVEKVPGAWLSYTALLAVTGGLARRFPHSFGHAAALLAMPRQRRGDFPT